ncbi:LPXTG cell wall anchor domain-containing protein [Streptococcus infantis]|uniref:LPXTG cell wall anchor domain-containing protein n=1 Tax=Streptococcus infantis TaxID=68892 RepID=UPI001CBF16E2|nr:LPXTG cell wall anchor domain-containing protein [Streptococcus infantis]
MKTNKVTKLGVSLLSVAALGVVAPALIDVPVFGVSIVKADENQEPLKYRITYYDSEAAVQIADEMTGTINPGETINIYKNIDGYEITSKYSWMPNYDMTYDIANEYFYGSRDGYNDMFLEYKKVDADAKPSEEVKPETKPSDTPKPEVKPEPKPSDTPKPEVKPEPAPKSEERQGQIKIRIRYLDEHSREIAPMYTGVLNPGESVNIYKDIEGHQVVSNFSWMPGYNLTYNIASTYFYGAKDGYLEGYLRYKKLDPTPTPKPEVKPETKPSETPKPEVKPEPKPSETPKPEVKPEPKPSETRKPEVKPETKPSDTPKPEVKPEPKPSETPKPEVKPEPKPSDTPKPEVKPAPKPSDTSKPEVKPAPKPSETPKPEVKPETKPSETPKPEVKPEPKPSDTSKPEVKPGTTPSETPKSEVKPAPKPSDTPKPEVKPEPKPSDTSKPEVKPELKPQTNSNTAPTAPVKPIGQTSNSKADKSTSKKETPALPNTGEQSSSLSLVGLLLASLGLAGLTYKGRH